MQGRHLRPVCSPEKKLKLNELFLTQLLLSFFERLSICYFSANDVNTRKLNGVYSNADEPSGCLLPLYRENSAKKYTSYKKNVTVTVVCFEQDD